MEDLEFIEYIETPFLKFDGVAYIRCKSGLGDLMLAFKVVSKKDGTGKFIVEPTWKLEANGIEEWKPWVVIDSNIAKQKLINLIMKNLKPQEPSAFDQGTEAYTQTVINGTASQDQKNNTEDDLPF